MGISLIEGIVDGVRNVAHRNPKRERGAGKGSSPSLTLPVSMRAIALLKANPATEQGVGLTRCGKYLTRLWQELAGAMHGGNSEPSSKVHQ
jgi:hypothetical protein